MTHEVVVGNIGTVYSGTSKLDALAKYKEYVSQSKANYGRAAGESVTLFTDNEIAKEYLGKY